MATNRQTFAWVPFKRCYKASWICTVQLSENFIIKSFVTLNRSISGENIAITGSYPEIWGDSVG